MGNLEHDTCSVASLVVGTFSTAVSHVLKHLQRIVNQLVALVSVNVNHHTDSTCVVFIGGIIQSICHI